MFDRNDFFLVGCCCFGVVALTVEVVVDDEPGVASEGADADEAADCFDLDLAAILLPFCGLKPH